MAKRNKVHFEVSRDPACGAPGSKADVPRSTDPNDTTCKNCKRTKAYKAAKAAKAKR